MFNRNKESAEQAWKTKYFNSLEELETKEKQWSGLEMTMRTGMSRLSIMLDGMDKELDKELNFLRRSLRKGADGTKISGIIRSMLETLEKVEARRGNIRQRTPAELYNQLLNSLALPKGTARKVKALTKSISKLKDDSPTSGIIEDFADLIRYSLTLIRDETREKIASEQVQPVEIEQAAKAPVVTATPEDKPAQTDTNVQKTNKKDLTQETGVAGRQLLEAFIGQLSLPDELQQDISQIHRQLQAATIEQELNQLAVRMAMLLNEALPSEHALLPIEGMDAADHALTINEVLLQLLERIELPEELGDEVEQIQRQLEGDVSDDEWPDLLEQISTLIKTMREKAQQEKKNLETFLSQLTDQLSTLDHFISGLEDDHNESITNGVQLRETLDNHIQHIGQSVDEALELDLLKQNIRERLTAIAEHMDSFRVHEEARDDSAQKKIQELNEKIQAMEEDSDKLRKKIMHERERASLDPLTGIKNRMAYNERIEQDYARWKRYHTPLSMMVIDIDHFKKINDGFGHIAGDKVLRTVAQLLQKQIRETDFLARYGGEEFVILMSDTPVQEALSVAEKLRDAIEHCGFHYQDEAVRVTISAGVAEFLNDEHPARVFEKADEAMYRAKENGRNQCSMG